MEILPQLGTWGPWGVALVALITLVFNWWSNRATILDKRIEEKVLAKFGESFERIQQLRNEGERGLSEVSRDTTQRLQELTEQANRLQSVLSETIGHCQEYTDRMEQILPQLSLLDVTANTSLLQARIETDPIKVTSWLAAVLDNPDADAGVLEAAGDLARIRLGNRPLARRLYQRAVEVDPESISAMAELYGMQATVFSERAEAKQKVIELARRHPNNLTVISRLLDFFMYIDDHSGTCEMFQELLNCSFHKAYLWRNLAIAYEGLGEDPDKIREAFENGLRAAPYDDASVGNVSGPYGRFLIRIGDSHKAVDVLRMGVNATPSEADLHVSLGDAYRATRQYNLARQSYTRVLSIGNAAEVSTARNKLRDLDILQELDSPTLSVTTGRDGEGAEDFSETQI